MKIDIEEFANLAASRVVSADPAAKVSLDRSELTLKIENLELKTKITINLRTYYYEYFKEPAMLDEIISGMILHQPHTDTIPDSFDEAKGRLYIHVQDRWLIESQKLLCKLGLPPYDDAHPIKQFRLPYVEFGDCFALVVAYDTPVMRHIVDAGTIESWNVDFTEVVEFAAAQLVSRSISHFEQIPVTVTKRNFLGIQTAQIDKTSKVYKSTWEDGYDAARVWTPALYSELEVNGQQVAVIPSAMTLVITGTTDWNGLSLALSASLFERDQGPKPLPPFPLIFENFKPKRYQLPENHPLYLDFKRAQDMYWTTIYQQQAGILKQMNECAAGELNVAQHYNVAPKNKERDVSMTLCTVLEGISNIIPQTDYIQFARIGEDGKHQICANGEWGRVMAVCGKYFRPYHDYYPKRFQIDKLPSVAQLNLCKTEAWQLDVF